MFDKVLAAGAAMDWFTPALAFVQDWINGPTFGFAVDVRAGYSLAAIRHVLEGHGIKVWGMMLVEESILFNTRTAQARFAAYLLQRNGIPFASSSPVASTTPDRTIRRSAHQAAARRTPLRRRTMSRRGISALDHAVTGLQRLIDAWG